MQTRDEAWEALDEVLFELVEFARVTSASKTSPKTIKSMVCALMIFEQLVKTAGSAATRYAVESGHSSKVR